MRYEGFHKSHELPLKNGDVVLIPKGTPFKSTHPSKKSGVTGMNQTICVNHLLNGYAGEYDRVPNSEKENPSVRWAGTGGYWKWVDINDIREANLVLFEKREQDLA